jgi:hypothetical protein
MEECMLPQTTWHPTRGFWLYSSSSKAQRVKEFVNLRAQQLPVNLGESLGALKGGGILMCVYLGGREVSNIFYSLLQNAPLCVQALSMF